MANLKELKVKQWYRMILTRDITESAEITVLAGSPEEARELVLDPYETDHSVLNWKVDEGNETEVYLGDPEDIEEIGWFSDDQLDIIFPSLD